MNISVREFVAPREEPIMYPGKRPSYSYLTDGAKVHSITFDGGDIMKGMVYLDGKWCDLSVVLDDLGSGKLIKKYPILAFGSNASPGQLLYKFKKRKLFIFKNN